MTGWVVLVSLHFAIPCLVRKHIVAFCMSAVLSMAMILQTPFLFLGNSRVCHHLVMGLCWSYQPLLEPGRTPLCSPFPGFHKARA